MSYLATDQSVELGQPNELFRFFNTEETFAYTTDTEPFLFSGDTYVPQAISRTRIDLQNIKSRRNIVVKLPITNDFVQRYIVTVPASIDEFELFRRHTTDTPTPEVIQYFSGTVTNVSFQGNEAQVNINNFGSILERLIPQQTSRNPCNHILYDTKCAVVDTQHNLTGTVTAVSASGLEVTIDTGADTVADTGLALTAQLSADSDYFLGGFLRRAGIEHRMVRALTDLGGNTAKIEVIFPFQTIGVGTSLTMFAGCDHQLPTCIAKFANSDRYGGFPFVPLKNPFEIGVKGG